MRQKGIQHRRITPLWPPENAKVERFMKPLTKICQTSYIEKKDLKNRFYRFLFTYRSTPHCTTKIPPAELMFKRKIRYSIPSFDYNNQEYISNKVERNDRASKEKSETYTDTRKHIGDRVLVKEEKQNKITPKFQTYPYKVVTAESENIGKVITQNISFYKEIPETSKISHA